MEWVLMLIMIDSLGNGGIATAEFNDEAACIYAGKQAALSRTFDLGDGTSHASFKQARVGYKCVPKGTP